MEFQVRKSDLTQTRLVKIEPPTITDGQVLAKIDRFAFTSNNITYGVAAELVGYWNFFPPQGEDADAWGILPIWGYADIVESKAEGVSVGDRFYGYFPTSTHLALTPTKVSPQRMVDGSPHRQELPPVYNTYQRVEAGTNDVTAENEQAILFPLHKTSYCLYDFLLDNQSFGAKQIIIVSASSKTSIGLAYAIHNDPALPNPIGLTSALNVDMVESLGLYERAVAYDKLQDINNTIPSLIVDMSGSAQVLNDLFAHLGDNMNFCINVGLTHKNNTNTDAAPAQHEKSAFFFAPAHILKRHQDLGPKVFEQNCIDFMQQSARHSRQWMNITTLHGINGLAKAYPSVQQGQLKANTALIIQL